MPKIDPNYLLVGIVVAVLAVGQITFKYAAKQLVPADDLVSFVSRNTAALGFVAAALVLYALATVAWVQALRYVPLSTAYMFNAAAFVLVPSAGFLLFGEALPRFFLLGAAAIIGGIVLISLP